jgi:hypothetical protein
MKLKDIAVFVNGQSSGIYENLICVHGYLEMRRIENIVRISVIIE